MDKKDLQERDIITQFVLPALARMGWDIQSQVREEFPLTAGRVIEKGTRQQAQLRGTIKRAAQVVVATSKKMTQKGE